MASMLKRLSGALAALVALALMAPMGAVPALALDAGGLADDGSASITVHKYKTQSASSTPGTGEDGQGLPVGAQPLEGVSFTLYRLDNAKVEGAVAGTAAPAGAPTADDVAAFLATYRDNGFAPNVQTTDPDGTATWASLAFGYYLLVETDAGGANVDPAVPSIVTVPYARQAMGGSTSYAKDVHVYPKNVSREEVEKTAIGAPDVTAPGEKLEYQIAFMVPEAGKVHASDAAAMKATVVDRLPLNAAGQPVLTVNPSFTVTALSKGGDTTALNAGDIVFSDTSASDGLVTWTFGPEIAKAIEGINSTNASNVDGQVVKVLLGITATVNDNAYNGGIDATGQPSIANIAVATVSDSDGTVMIDGKESVTPAVTTMGFKLTKVDADGNPVTSDSATFKLAASYADAVAGTFIKNGSTSADLTATSSLADGTAVFSGLSARALTSGGAAYTGIGDAVAAARANLGAPQTVELWLVETDAPDGYRILQAPQKVTLRIAKATADATVSSTVVDGPLSVVNTMNGQEGGGNFALPNTGGMGAVAFLVAGAALVAFAVASFARSRKGGKHGPSGR